MTTLSPAYGRDYKSQKQVLTDWQEGKDFQLENVGRSGCYCSIRDQESLESNYGQIKIRYRNLTSLIVIPLLKKDK